MIKHPLTSDFITELVRITGEFLRTPITDFDAGHVMVLILIASLLNKL